jgi:hypothetical protein
MEATAAVADLVSDLGSDFTTAAGAAGVVATRAAGSADMAAATVTAADMVAAAGVDAVATAVVATAVVATAAAVAAVTDASVSSKRTGGTGGWSASVLLRETSRAVVLAEREVGTAASPTFPVDRLRTSPFGGSPPARFRLLPMSLITSGDLDFDSAGTVARL